MNKLDTLYELLEKSCHDIIQSEESWLSFLKHPAIFIILILPTNY